MEIIKLIKEFYRYGQVRLIIVLIGVGWTTFFVDVLGFSGFATVMLYIPTIGVITFIFHKLRGATF